ncbi:hypothetical protein ACIA78_21400 [Streptomyces xanthochromogenes]|uniref:hypothetical protein n=1 Tax=Streptomyces xanthochromogenes TaxID=67384 RepID=UPI00378C68D4
MPGAAGLLAEAPERALAPGLLCYRYGSALYLWSAVVDQARDGDLHTHGWLMYESVNFAVATSAGVLDTGLGHHGYQVRLGMLPVALTSAVHLTAPQSPPHQPPRCPAHRSQPARPTRLG